MNENRPRAHFTINPLAEETFEMLVIPQSQCDFVGSTHETRCLEPMSSALLLLLLRSTQFKLSADIQRHVKNGPLAALRIIKKKNDENFRLHVAAKSGERKRSRISRKCRRHTSGRCAETAQTNKILIKFANLSGAMACAASRNHVN